ncbi:hypothetical protein KVR01_008170 [Diaporthe batatas]|uniref:uncharacterized protein n=1 Tax=Diaporthe batatas TaxID=748121 RepID=UPI001D04A776|nr:uncharacterized protein KVR01_008170 [Diaporthe batatas]KAG8162405.1 hypothetical protein KVR01_008170 [Diaporthe batatas]
MDHILRSKHSNPPLEFPYYDPAAWEHDVKHLDVWRRYDLDEFLKGGPFNEFAAFLQSWLYFGVLAVCLGRNDLSGFIKVNSAGEKVLNTTLLIPFVQEWYDGKFQRHMEIPDSRAGFALEFRELTGVLDSVAKHTDRLTRFGKKDAGPLGAALFRICVSINLVQSVLRSAVFELGRLVVGTFNYTPMPDPLGTGYFSVYPAGSELRGHLVRRGWCPNKIRNMSQSLGLEGLMMASMIQKDASVSAAHARCLDSVCVANQIQAGTFVPKHADEYHNQGICGGIGLPRGTAEKILLGTNSFPVVRFWLGSNREGPRHRRMEAVPFQDGLKYIAISHVWSDGLGDETGNTILACQYDRLEALLAEVRSMETIRESGNEKPDDAWSPHFWLDTICVPHERAARRLACARMASSYECADTVLVLDAELQAWSYNSESATDEEALFRIVSSGWTTRVWTLSEGILAKRLVFKLADTMFDYAACGDRLRLKKMKGLGRFDTIPALLYNDLRQMRSIDRMDAAQKLITAMSYTQSRRTSHAGDEIISIAVLMGMNHIEELCDQPTWAGKMMLFLEMMPELPLRLLFSSGPRITETGFRWAPAALNSDLGIWPFNSLEDIAHLDHKSGGLVLSHQGILLHGDWASIVPNHHKLEPFEALYRQLPLDRDLDYDLTIIRGEEDWCLIESHDEWHLPLEGERRQYCSEDAYYRKNDEALTTTALAIIIDAPNFGVDNDGIELMECMGALVSNVTLEDSGTISCRYQAMVKVTKCWRKSGPMSAEYEVLHYSAYGGEGLDITGVDQAMFGTYRVTNNDQVWRIM